MSIVRNAIKCSAANCRWKPIRGGSTERAKGASVTFAAPTSGIMMIDDDKLMIMTMTDDDDDDNDDDEDGSPFDAGACRL